MAERAVRAALIVVDAPGFDLRLRIGDRRELVHVQALIAEPSVERLDEGVFHWFAWSNEIALHAALIGPVLERPRPEFGAVIDVIERGPGSPVSSYVTLSTPTIL
jgi:hypothetical protein